MKLAILGAGAWGTALAVSLGMRHPVALWARRPEHAAQLAAARRNDRYLPDIAIPPGIRIGADLAAAIHDAELLIIVTSTGGLGMTLAAVQALRADVPLLWACKGFESTTGRLPHEIVAAHVPAGVPRGALSGPSFALEVAQGKPAALTLAADDGRFAAGTAASLNGPSLRIYSSQDLIGVELGGALKNVIAIASGICDGLGLGNNARAALITRGLAEMTRLGVKRGGLQETFMGLTGLGDLMLTATGDLSRNRAVGRKLASGMSLDAILAELGHVAEGVNSARAARSLARQVGVDMPITDAVCAVLFDGLPPQQAVERLLSRDPGVE